MILSLDGSNGGGSNNAALICSNGWWKLGKDKEKRRGRGRDETSKVREMQHETNL
jgi:hypothetical protein